MILKHNVKIIFNNNIYRIILALLCVFVIFLREPNFFFQPRLWAEEGNRYFAFAYNQSQIGFWYKGLLNVQRGYFALWPNIASTISANLIPIENAPLIMTTMALLIQIIPFIIIIWSKSKIWENQLMRYLALLVLLFTPLSGEVWLNTINSQFFLSLITFLILFEATTNKVKNCFFYLLIIIAGLTGPVSCLLTPIYIIRFYQERNKERLRQTIILGCCTIFQMSFFIISSKTDASIISRFTDFNFSAYILSLFSQSLSLVFLGKKIAILFSNFVFVIYDKSTLYFTVLVVITLFIEIIFFKLVIARIDYRERYIFLGAYFLLTFFSVTGSLTSEKLALVHTGTNQRYFFVPNVILLLMVLMSTKQPNFKWNLFISTIVAIALLLGISGYKNSILADKNWPNWKNEVLTWKNTTDYNIHIWPPDWYIVLHR